MFDDSTPIFMQLADQLCAEIVAGTYPDGAKAPSINELAVFHRINPATANPPATDKTAVVDPADLRIGFVNFRRIMAAAPQREEINERLEREFGVERDALLQAQSELRSMERQLETLQHGDNYNDYERQVINKRRDVARRDSDYRDNINVRRNEEMAKLQKMIGDEILSHAKEAGYDVILNDIGVFYVSERADLSPLIIKRLQNKAGKP